MSDPTKLIVSIMAELERQDYAKLSPLDCKLIALKICRDVPELAANTDALRACELIANLDVFKKATDGRTVALDARMYECAVTMARAAIEKAG